MLTLECTESLNPRHRDYEWAVRELSLERSGRRRTNLEFTGGDHTQLVFSSERFIMRSRSQQRTRQGEKLTLIYSSGSAHQYPKYVTARGTVAAAFRPRGKRDLEDSTEKETVGLVRGRRANTSTCRAMSLCKRLRRWNSRLEHLR